MIRLLERLPRRDSVEIGRSGDAPTGRIWRESWFGLLRAGAGLGRMRVPVELAGSPLLGFTSCLTGCAGRL